VIAITANMPLVSIQSPFRGKRRPRKICTTYPTSGISGTARSSLKSVAGSNSRRAIGGRTVEDRGRTLGYSRKRSTSAGFTESKSWKTLSTIASATAASAAARMITKIANIWPSRRPPA